MSDSKPRRLWLRYSLRTMLVVVLALSVWLGWMANQAAKQRRAVALVRELGGNVYFECQLPVTKVTGAGQGFGIRAGTGTANTPGGIPWQTFLGWDITAPGVPKYEPIPDEGFLHKYFGHEWFHDVVHVKLVGPDVNDEVLRRVADDLPNIVQLTLAGCSVTDAGFEHVASLNKLEVLNQENCGFTRKALSQLQSRRPDLQITYRAQAWQRIN